MPCLTNGLIKRPDCVITEKYGTKWSLLFSGLLIKIIWGMIISVKKLAAK